jgi:phage shock protein PspC (stress-responsive transcriptional regulator)
MTEENGTSPRRLTRSAEGRLITGVCAGLARYTRIDAVVFRVGFALLVLTTGVGVLLYIGAYLVMATPDGGPSRIERAGKRLFDGDTALALIGAALAAATLLGVVGSWGSGDGLAVLVVFALTLFVARSRGVDLPLLARSMPERVKGRPISAGIPSAPVTPAYRRSDGMIDLARLGQAHTADPGSGTDHTYAAGSPVAEPYVTGSGTADPDATTTRLGGTWPPDVTPPSSDRPRSRSYLTGLTLAAAAAVAGIMYAVAGDRPMFARTQIILAGALTVVAAGLLLGAWFGRARKLITIGAVMSLALASTSIGGDAVVARRTHHTMWRPAVAAQAQQSHKVFIGESVIDLTAVPLAPGQRLQVSAQVTLGVLAVKVPSGARVEVDGHALLGDITVDRQVTSGPSARVRRVLEPEGRTGGIAPTIALRIRSKIGDMEVTRVPA